MGQRYCRLENQKPWPVCVAQNQDFAVRRGLNPLPRCKLGNVLSKLVQLKRITYRGVGPKSRAARNYRGLRTKPPAAGQFFVFCFQKNKLF